MAATYKVAPETARRVVSLIAHFNGDLSAAMHDVRIGLQSLGNYTDRKSEAVLDLLKWLHVRDEKFPDTIRSRRDSLARIADQTVKPQSVRVSLVCNECGKQWKVRPNADPQCPKCNGVDYEVAQ